MGTPTPEDVAKWRGNPHEIEIYAYIHKPSTVFSARVNMAALPPETVSLLTFDNVTSGSYTNIKAGFTLMIGSAAGKSDYGMTQVYANSEDGIVATSSTISVMRSSIGNGIGMLAPHDNAYITVKEHRKLWAEPSYISAEGTIYKGAWRPFDPDNYLLPMPMMSTDVLLIVDNPEDTVEFDTAALVFSELLPGRSTHPDADLLPTSHLWDVGDGIVEDEEDLETALPVVTFGVGKRYISYTPTDSLGQSETGYAFIVVLNKDHEDLIKGSLTRHNQDLVGQQVELELISDQLEGTLYGSEVLVTCIERYGGIEGSIDFYSAPDVHGMLFAGWMTNFSDIRSGGETGPETRITVTAVDNSRFLQLLPGFGQVFLRKNSPTNWMEIEDADVFKCIYHILRWNSNAVQRCGMFIDHQLKSYNITALNVQESSLYDQIKYLCDVCDYNVTGDYYGRMVVSANDNIHVTIDQWNEYSNIASMSPIRSISEMLTIIPGDVASGTFERMSIPESSWNWVEALIISEIEASIDDDVENLETAFCVAPGYAPAQGTSSKSKTMIALSPIHAALRAGNMFASKDHLRSGRVRLTFARGGRVGIDVANGLWVKLEGFDEAMGIEDDLPIDDLYLPMSIDYVYNHEQGTQQISLELEKFAVGNIAQLYVPDSGTGLPELPPIDDVFPPVVIQPPYVSGLRRGEQTIIAFADDGEVYITGPEYNASGFTVREAEGGPDWDSFSLWDLIPGGAISGEIVCSMASNAFSPKYLGTGDSVSAWISTTHRILFIDNITTTPTVAVCHTFSSSPYAGTIIQTERSIPNYVVCMKLASSGSGGAGFMEFLRSTDGSTFSSDASVGQSNTTFFGGNMALWMSPRGASPTNCKILIDAPSSSVNASYQVRQTTNGTSFSAISGFTSGAFSGCYIAVPYKDTTETHFAYAPANYSVSHITGTIKPNYPAIFHNGSYSYVFSATPNVYPMICTTRSTFHTAGHSGLYRAWSFADDSLNYAIFCGELLTDSATGLQSDPRIWLIQNPLTAPTTSLIYDGAESFLGGYMTDKNTAYCIGMSGAIGYYDRNLTTGQFDIRTGNISTSAAIVGLMGG